jgi:hypothetical protein
MKNIFQKKIYLLIEVLFIVIFASFFIFYPIFTTPGNSLKAQLLFLKPFDYLMIFVLSFLISSNLTLMIYKKKELKMKILPSLSLGGAGSILGILSGILASALCLSCLVPLFAFLGLGVGTLFFAFKYKFYIFLISSIILAFSLYLSYKSINKCEKC